MILKSRTDILNVGHLWCCHVTRKYALVSYILVLMKRRDIAVVLVKHGWSAWCRYIKREPNKKK